MADDIAIAKSYVYNQSSKRWYFVSTIERDSSAIVDPPPRFCETIAWEWVPEYETTLLPGTRGKCVAEEGSRCFEGIALHGDVCAQLVRTGKYMNPEDDDG